MSWWAWLLWAAMVAAGAGVVAYDVRTRRRVDTVLAMHAALDARREQALFPADPEFCPGHPDGQHCYCWSECEPCHYCGDDTPDPLCDCERCAAVREGIDS